MNPKVFVYNTALLAQICYIDVLSLESKIKVRYKKVLFF